MTIKQTVLALGITLVAGSAAAEGLSCRAIYRTVDENRRGIEFIEAMPISQRIGIITQYAVDHRGRHFHVSDDGTETFLVQITVPPDYTQGIVVRAAPDAQGRLNVAEVDGHTVYKIECMRR